MLIASLGWFSITQLEQIGGEIDDIASEHIPLTRSITLVTEYQLQVAIGFERVIAHALLDEIKGHGHSKESLALETALDKSLLKLHDEVIKTERLIENATQNLHTEANKEKIYNFLVNFKKIEEEFFTLEEKTHHFLEKIMKHGILDVIGDVPELEHQYEVLDNNLIELLNTAQSFSIASAETAREDELHSVKIIMTTLGIALAFSIFIPILIGRAITTPIGLLIERIQELVSGGGDLTLRINSKAKDEVGDIANALDSFMEKLQDIITTVNSSSTSLGQSSEVATNTIKNTLASVEHQRIATERVVSAMTQMSQTTGEVARNTAEASSVTEQVKNRVLEGRQSAEDTQDIIKRLADDVKSTSTDINGLMKETNNIGMVLETIQGIAEQTNLLALNAAIEAARAGETGRGFAVVADEVRSLAQRTQDSTVSIQELVETLQKEANHAVGSMARGLSITEECLEKSLHTAQVFEDAASAVNEISDFNIQIEKATEEQVEVAHLIQKDLENINSIAKKTSENAEQAESSNKSIAVNLMDLHSSLNQFKV
ncbi:methyl-accepting chemotaxis protein [Marinomonas sp. 2405UD68-3]|uniref:methyl-accepting chemotaxis protein n=1 Tax=Marinomonas sp. 2405UD68-3 TaxID=3391835 RepID=UPI0039C9BFD9